MVSALDLADSWGWVGEVSIKASFELWGLDQDEGTVGTKASVEGFLG